MRQLFCRRKGKTHVGNPVILSFISETDFSGESTGFFSGQYDRFFDFFSADDHRDRNRDVHFIGKLPATGYSLAPSYASAVPGHFPDRHYADCSFSAKARSVEDAQQGAVFLILPVILLIAGQFTGILLVDFYILLLLSIISAAVAWLLLHKAMGTLHYEELL